MLYTFGSAYNGESSLSAASGQQPYKFVRTKESATQEMGST